MSRRTPTPMRTEDNQSFWWGGHVGTPPRSAQPSDPARGTPAGVDQCTRSHEARLGLLHWTVCQLHLNWSGDRANMEVNLKGIDGSIIVVLTLEVIKWLRRPNAQWSHIGRSSLPSVRRNRKQSHRVEAVWGEGL